MSDTGGAAAVVEKKFTFGRDTIDYNECPPHTENLLSSAFVKQLVGQFNNEDPDKSFTGEWKVFAKSKPEPSDRIKYCMAKKYKEGFPIIELMGYAEFEGVSAKACWETMENHKVRMSWDGNMQEFSCIEMVAPAGNNAWHEIAYSKTKFPFPLSPRDCCYNKYVELNDKAGVYFCVWRPCSHSAVPKQRKVTRSWSYGAQLMFQMPGNKMRVWQAGCGDPKGSIPAWLINYAMPKIAVSGIKELRSKTEEVQTRVSPDAFQAHRPAAPFPSNVVIDDGSSASEKVPAANTDADDGNGKEENTKVANVPPLPKSSISTVAST